MIKIESLGNPDSARGLGHSPAPGMAGCVLYCARGKRSIVIDMKQEAGRNVFMKFAAEADLLLQNYRPGAMERMGTGQFNNGPVQSL